MKQGIRLEIRQSQQLVMTPQLQQAIRLLQMNNLDLAAHVESQLAENPLLMRLDAGTGEASATPPARKEPTGEEAPGDDPSRVDAVFDTGHENLYGSVPLAGVRAGHGGGDASDIGERAHRAPSLRETVVAALGEMRASPDCRALAECIAGELDQDGYFREPTDAFAARMGVSAAAVWSALALVQQAAPAGVGARSLAECLALQLAERGRLDPMMERFLDNLDLLARGDRRRLRLATGADDEDLAEMIAEIRRLDPAPGAAFAAEPTVARVADVMLRALPGGEWQIELNPATLPRVALDRAYAERFGPRGTETGRWIADRRAEAHWLVRSIDKRSRTIIAVAGEILRRQADFFEGHAEGLRPLTLRQVAEATGLHESTVSRVTANKHIATPRGIFELKYFFTNAIAGSEELSSETVRQRIRALVDSEAPGAPLADDTLVEKLRGEGIEIARRTVAKYRKALKIPSSVERRRRAAMG